MSGGPSSAWERERRIRSISPSDRALPSSAYRQHAAVASAGPDHEDARMQGLVTVKQEEEIDELADMDPLMEDGEHGQQPTSAVSHSARNMQHFSASSSLPRLGDNKITPQGITLPPAIGLPTIWHSSSGYDKGYQPTPPPISSSSSSPIPSSVPPPNTWLPPINVGREDSRQHGGRRMLLPQPPSWGSEARSTQPMSRGPSRFDATTPPAPMRNPPLLPPPPPSPRSQRTYPSPPSAQRLRFQEGSSSTSTSSRSSKGLFRSGIVESEAGGGTSHSLRRATSTDSLYASHPRAGFPSMPLEAGPSRSPTRPSMPQSETYPPPSQHPQHFRNHTTTSGRIVDSQHQTHQPRRPHSSGSGRAIDGCPDMSLVSPPHTSQPFYPPSQFPSTSSMPSTQQKHYVDGRRMLPPLSTLTASLPGHPPHPSSSLIPLAPSSASMPVSPPIRKRTWEDLAVNERNGILRDRLHRFMIHRAEAEAAVFADPCSSSSSTMLKRRLAKARDDADDDYFVTVTCSHSGVAQKSYGHEKRFLCPPPIVKVRGAGYSKQVETSEAARRVHLRMNILPVSEGGAPSTGMEEGTIVSEDIMLDPTLNAKFGHLHVGATSNGAKSFQLQLQLFEPMQTQATQAQQSQRSSNLHGGSNGGSRPVKSPRLNTTADGGPMLPSPSSASSRYGPTSASTSSPSSAFYYGNDTDPIRSRNVSHNPQQQSLSTAASVPSRPDDVVNCISEPITVISKPSKKTTRAKTSSTQITPRLAICLFNRVNSQNVRTRYMAVDQGRLSARNDSWTTFYMKPVGRLGGHAEDGKGSGNWGEEEAAVTYGSIIVLELPNQGVVSDEMVVCKVEKGKIIVPTGYRRPFTAMSSTRRSSLSPTTPISEGAPVEGGPISQMQKVALMKYEPSGSTERSSLAPPDQLRRDDTQSSSPPRLFLCSAPPGPWWRPMGANESDFSTTQSLQTPTQLSSSSSSSSSPHVGLAQRGPSSSATPLQSLASSEETSISTPPSASSSSRWGPPKAQQQQEQQESRSPFADASSETPKVPGLGNVAPPILIYQGGRTEDPRSKSLSPIDASARRGGAPSQTGPASAQSTPVSTTRLAFNAPEYLAPTALTFLPAGRDRSGGTASSSPTKKSSGSIGRLAGSAGSAGCEDGFADDGGAKDQDVADDAFCWSIVGAASFEYSFCRLDSMSGSTEKQVDSPGTERTPVNNSNSNSGATSASAPSTMPAGVERPWHGHHVRNQGGGGPPTTPSMSGTLRSLTIKPSYDAETHSLHLYDKSLLPTIWTNNSHHHHLDGVTSKSNNPSTSSGGVGGGGGGGSLGTVWPGITLWLASFGPLNVEPIPPQIRQRYNLNVVHPAPSPLGSISTFPSLAAATGGTGGTGGGGGGINKRESHTPTMQASLPPLAELLRYATGLMESSSSSLSLLRGESISPPPPAAAQRKKEGNSPMDLTSFSYQSSSSSSSSSSGNVTSNLASSSYPQRHRQGHGQGHVSQLGLQQPPQAQGRLQAQAQQSVALPLLLINEVDGLICKTPWALELVKTSSHSHPPTQLQGQSQGQGQRHPYPSSSSSSSSMMMMRTMQRSRDDSGGRGAGASGVNVVEDLSDGVDGVDDGDVVDEDEDEDAGEEDELEPRILGTSIGVRGSRSTRSRRRNRTLLQPQRSPIQTPIGIPRQWERDDWGVRVVGCSSSV